MKPRTKEIEISDQKFRIGKLLPDVGSFILMQMIGAGFKRQMEAENHPAPAAEPASDVPRETLPSDDAVRGLAFSAFLDGLDFKQFQFIQQQCLRVCARLEGSPHDPAAELPMPILMKDGRWAITEIRDDVTLVVRLTIETLVFNLSDFFEQGGLNQVEPAPASRPKPATE